MTRFHFFGQIPVGTSFYPFNTFVMEPKTNAPYRKVSQWWREDTTTGKQEFTLPVAMVKVVED